MKIKTHYVYGKRNTVACGRRGGFLTTNYREITCKSCLRTLAHKAVVTNAKTQPK